MNMKTIQILRPQTISIHEVEEMDLEILPQDQLLLVAKELLNALVNIDAHPEPISMLTKHPRIDYEHKVGIKTGKSSKFHYVDFSQGKFRGTITINKKANYLGRFVNEQDAALAVDTFLDSLPDNKRPLNRDAFPELLLCRGIAK